MAKGSDRRTRNWMEEQKQKNWILEQKHQKQVQMPEGYYSGDKPNPNLRAFVEAHMRERPYDPLTDDYDVPAFTEPLTIKNRRDPINDLHIYWSKKPYQAIRQYVRHFTSVGDLVLDPFCGSGGTSLAALMEGRKTIAIDRSPAATFITKNYCTPIDPKELQRAFRELEVLVKPELDWLYETRCDRCGGRASTSYTVFSRVFQCPRCMEKMALFDCIEVVGATSKGKPKQIRICGHCHSRGILEEIGKGQGEVGVMPVMVSYICKDGCRPARGERRHNDPNLRKVEFFEKYDRTKILEIEGKEIPYWFPNDRMMHATEDQKRWGMLWRPYLQGISTVSGFYTKRNLWGLATLLNHIQTVSNQKDQLLFCFSGSLYNASRMYQQRAAGGGPAKGTYYVPPIFREVSVWTLFSEKVTNLLRSAEMWSSPGRTLFVQISTETATQIDAVKNNSVDYIFTDPPYSWKVQYGESNFLWEAWLGLDTRWHEDEIIVNELRGKKEADWLRMMRQAFAECYRVLKPGRWLSLCYHDTSEGTWALVQDIMAEVGFLADSSDSALFIDTGQKAWKQIVADKVSKRDLIINFRKPKPGEVGSLIAITGDEDAVTFHDKVRTIIHDHLAAYPGATKDRIYDEVVSRMVRSGLMEAHNFEELLRQVAEPAGAAGNGSERWYLKASEMDETDRAEAAKEDGAAEKTKAFMADYLKSHPGAEGVHYSDIFEYYVYAVKDKPRRPLAEWLLDYFYKTDAGTYRLPASEEEDGLKADNRKKGTLRRIKRYFVFLEQGVAIPEKERQSDATLAEWLRHCARTGLYGQGKLLYEKGGLNPDSLPEDLMASVEEDYQVCARMLARSETKPQKSKGKKLT